MVEEEVYIWYFINDDIKKDIKKLKKNIESEIRTALESNLPEHIEPVTLEDVSPDVENKLWKLKEKIYESHQINITFDKKGKDLIVRIPDCLISIGE